MPRVFEGVGRSLNKGPVVCIDGRGEQAPHLSIGYTSRMTGQDNRTLLAALEAEQQRLRSIIADRDPATLSLRPPSGKWSVIENVRHLVFAEQSHFVRFVPGGPAWSRFGLPPGGMHRQERFARMVGTETSDIYEVLEAWSAVHSKIRPHLEQEDERTTRALDRNLRHLRSHIRVIERLLRDR